MSFLSGLFDSGTNKAVSGTQGKYAKLFGGAFEDYNTLHSMFGAPQSAAIAQAFNSVNQPDQQKEAKYAAGANQAAAQQATQNASFLRSQGFGDGLVAGAGASAYQNAARQTNAYGAEVGSPEYHLQQLQQLMQAFQGANSPILQQLQLFGNGAYSAPLQQSPFASILGQFAGTAASALGKKV